MTQFWLPFWNMITGIVGAIVLIGGACVAFVWCWCAVSDWLCCEGHWTRCTKCGARTKEEE